MQFGSMQKIPVTLTDLFVAVAGELTIGLAMGTAIVIFFSGTILCGQIVGQMSGLALAQSYNPATDSNSSIFSSFFYWVVIGMYLSIGMLVIRSVEYSTILFMIQGIASNKARIIATIFGTNAIVCS